MSFLKKTSAAPNSNPIIGETIEIIYPIIGTIIVPSFSIFFLLLIYFIKTPIPVAVICMLSPVNPINE